MFMYHPKSLMWNIHTENNLNISLRDYASIGNQTSIFQFHSVLSGMNEFLRL